MTKTTDPAAEIGTDADVAAVELAVAVAMEDGSEWVVEIDLTCVARGEPFPGRESRANSSLFPC